MPLKHLKISWINLILVLLICMNLGVGWAKPGDSETFMTAFFSGYCKSCHGESSQQGNLNLHNVEFSFFEGDQLECWRMIAEQIRFRDMPPTVAKQPTAEERERALVWIRSRLLATQYPHNTAEQKRLLPEFGNLTDHEALFNSPASRIVPTTPGIWRKRPEIYDSLAFRISSGMNGLAQPFSTRNQSGFRDFGSLYFVDEPATDLLLQNADKLVKKQATLPQYEHVSAHVKRMLAEPLRENPCILQFFREYFGYPNAIHVFKDDPSRGTHRAQILVNDLEFLIVHILDADRDVLRELLTTDKAFVNWQVDEKEGTNNPAESELGYETVYGLPPDWKWTAQQPITLPAGERAGVLTHPAWLVAWSGNFDNDPVRRGKWIRTHLLGGSVPDVPIGVDARIPEDETKTLRERLFAKTSRPECWRCHRKMDLLGLPFEQYSHYGHFRNHELKKPVITTGIIERTGDPRLDGTQIEDPIVLVTKLAGSERVQQVFVRYVFRFFHGRNETLGDAETLQTAWKVYRSSGGSFKALVTSLLTSDSFLYRTP